MSERYKGSQVKGEQGMSLITVMMVLLIPAEPAQVALRPASNVLPALARLVA